MGARRRRRAGRMHARRRSLAREFPHAIPAHLASVAHALELIRIRALLIRRRPERLVDFARALMGAFDQVLAAGTSLGLAHEDIACKEGCGFCCRIKVQASPLEVLVLRAWLEGHASPERRASLVSALEELRVRTAGLDSRSRPLVACPLLEDDRCSAYPARPLACRGATSLDVRQCKSAFAAPDGRGEGTSTIPMDVFTQMLGFAFSNILRAVAAYSSRRLDLHTALEIALTQPDVEERWRRGEAPFAEARFGRSP